MGFCRHFGISRAKSAPLVHVIKYRNQQLEEIGSTQSKCEHKAPRTVRIPENVQYKSSSPELTISPYSSKCVENQAKTSEIASASVLMY